jgi:hypothetical protein
MAENTSIRARAEISRRCKKEVRKMTRFCRENGVDAEKIDALTPVFDSVCWMQIKLEDARTDIAEDGLTVEYDNGGGQSGIRENPAFKAYEALWKSYCAGLQIILAELPDAARDAAATAGQNAAPENALALVLGKRKDA